MSGGFRLAIAEIGLANWLDNHGGCVIYLTSRAGELMPIHRPARIKRIKQCNRRCGGDDFPFITILRQLSVHIILKSRIV